MRVLTLLSTITREHGGLTRASFRRSKALAELGYHVTLVSFNLSDEFEQVVDYVRENGELGDLEVVNCYEEMLDGTGEIPEEVARRHGLHKDRGSTYGDVMADGLQVADEYVAASGTRVIRYADLDGSVDVIEYRGPKGARLIDFHKKGDRQRRLVLVDDRGRITACGPNWNLQRAWLESFVGAERAVLVVDGPHLWSALASFSRPNMFKVMVNHGVHFDLGEHSSKGKLKPARLEPYRNARFLDAMVTLTPSQARDLRERIDPPCRIVAIPNANPVPEPPGGPRRPERIVVVSRIDEPTKRISHILRAFALASMQEPNLELTIYGGPEGSSDWNRLCSLAGTLGIGQRVEFAGHQERAYEEFWQAGFTLFTSRDEGQGMTLVEAMSRGCLPVAYDMNYGPRDTITSGLDGWLVPDGDINALAQQLLEAVSLGEERLQIMRDHAMSSADRYRPQRVAEQYAALFEDLDASGTCRNALRAVEPELESFRYAEGNTELRFRVKVPDLWERGVTRIQGRAVDNGTLAWLNIDATSVEMSSDALLVAFSSRGAPFAGLADSNVTGWIRVVAAGVTVDLRPKWPTECEVWPSRSRWGFLNLR